MVADAEYGVGLGDEVDEARVGGAGGHLGVHEGGADAELLTLLAEEHGVDARVSATYEGDDHAIGVHEVEELGGKAGDALLFFEALGAEGVEEDAAEVNVLAVSGVHVGEDAVVLVEVRGLPDAGRAVEGAVDDAVCVFVGVDESRLPAHRLAVEELGGLLAGVEELGEGGVYRGEFESVYGVGWEVCSDGGEPAGDLEAGLADGPVVPTGVTRAHDGVVVLGVGTGHGSGLDVEDEVGGA